MLSSARMWTSVILAGEIARVVSIPLTGFSENVVVAETSYRMLLNFVILRSGEGLTPFSKDDSANFLVKNK